MKRLWVVEYRSHNVPEPRFFPDWEALQERGVLDIIASDVFWIVVEADYNDLESIIRDYSYLKVAGHPADGRWVDAGGGEVYILDGQVVDSAVELWEGLEMRPETFGGKTWADVDEDVVWGYAPTF